MVGLISLLKLGFFFGLLLATVKCQEEIDEREKFILNWVPPKDFPAKFPYGMTGYDNDGSPVWVISYGAWDVRTLTEKGGKPSEDLDLYIEQMWTRMVLSPKLLSTPSEPRVGFFGIGDVDGFDLRQLSHLPTIQKFLVVARHFFRLVQKHKTFKKALIVNSNILFQTIWNIASPIVGHLRSQIDLYGTNSEKWQPKLLAYIPKESLPFKLGGTNKNV